MNFRRIMESSGDEYDKVYYEYMKCQKNKSIIFKNNNWFHYDIITTGIQCALTAFFSDPLLSLLIPSETFLFFKQSPLSFHDF